MIGWFTVWRYRAVARNLAGAIDPSFSRTPKSKQISGCTSDFEAPAPSSRARAIGKRTQVERSRRLSNGRTRPPLSFPGLPTDLAVSPTIALALLAELVFVHAGFAQVSAICVVSVVPVMVDVNAARPDFELCG
jgi:hypothetical protein